MNVLMFLNLVNLLLLLAAAVVVFSVKTKRRLPRDITLILLGLFCLMTFRHLSNTFEWSGAYTALDVYEDYIRILEPLFFGFLLFAFFQDRLKNKLRESETRYRLLIENQTDLIAKVDHEGRFLFVSPSYCRKFGMTEEDLLGMKYEGLVYEDDLPNTRIQWEKLFNPPHTCYFRQRAKTATGLRWIAWSCKAVLNSDGALRFVVAIGRDITEQVEAEAEREKLLQALEVKNRELQSIVYIASHDLQSPLVNIRGFAGELKRSISEIAELLLTDENRESRRRLEPIFSEIDESIHFITAGSEKMQTLIEGLLTVSRIGTIELNLQTVDMNRLINAVQHAMNYQIQQSRAKIEVEDLPPCRSDVNQLNQIFSNLLDNALKYLDASRPGRICIRGEQLDGLCYYHITDNGIGIEEHLQPKVFELFYRLHPNGPAKGVGLGLTIVSRLVERLGGSIRIQSAPGKGSTFTVCLPMAPPQ